MPVSQHLREKERESERENEYAAHISRYRQSNSLQQVTQGVDKNAPYKTDNFPHIYRQNEACFCARSLLSYLHLQTVSHQLKDYRHGLFLPLQERR